MDRDDNDFGGQNPQLNSKEVGKSSPVLSTYSLTKYDFEDGLQGDIRFDSLVETQAFLGIGSQEDTSWMDDFSRGSSSRIEFGSGDVEPSSISRGNNAWSEAASLESVEMLLKSVGQEELINEETEVQDCVQELGSSTLQLTPDEEEIDRICVKADRSGKALKVQEFPDDDAVLNESDTLSSPGQGNNADSILQEIDVRRIPCHVKEDTLGMNKDDNPSVQKKPELNQIKVSKSFESGLQEYDQARVLQNWPQITGEFTENLSSGLNLGNDSNNSLNQMVLVSGIQSISDCPLNDRLNGGGHVVLEKKFKSEGLPAENTVSKLDNVVSSEHLNAISGDEPCPLGTVDNQLKEPHGTLTKELCDFNSRGICLDLKCEFDKHIDTHVFEQSNVTLEGESALTKHAAESPNPKSGALCDEKLCSDVQLSGSAGVQKNSEYCEGAELAENPEGSVGKGNEIYAAVVEEDKSCGGSEQMENTVAIRKSEGSLTEDDGVVMINCAVVEEVKSCGGSEQMESTVAIRKSEGSLTEDENILRMPGDEMDSKLTVKNLYQSKVGSSAVLASVALGTEDTSVCIATPVPEEHISHIINNSASNTVERDTIENTASPDIADGNDKFVDTKTQLQSNPVASSVDDKIYNPGSLEINDTIVTSPVESVCYTQNVETLCNSPSAILIANSRDHEEPEIAQLLVSSGGENKDDSETENFIQCQSDKSGTTCSDGSVLRDPKASNASDNDKTFSFIITSSAEHSERKTVNLWQPFMSEVPVSSQNVEDSPLTPVVDQNILRNQGIHKITDERFVTGSNSASARKPTKPSGTTSKEITKRDSRPKPTTPSKLKDSNVSPIVGLNHSSLPILSRQQFSDLQQLQLRAQIFVYGSLIQGTTPDEACMVAAFGGPDGGRSIWEDARQQCLKRIQGQKSQDGKPETPPQPHSSARTSNQKSKTSKSQAKSKAVPHGKASKNTPTNSTIGNLTPPASPLWTLRTPDHMHFGGMPIGHNVHHQSNSHSSSLMTTTVAHTSSWSPHPAPWVASPQIAAGKANASLMMRSKMKPVILTPNRESSVSEISVRYSSPGPDSHSVGQNKAILEGLTSLLDERTLIMNSGLTVSESEPRKRKNYVLSEASMVTEPKVERASAACVSGTAPSTVAILNSESNVMNHASPLADIIASTSEHTTKINIESDDMCSKVDEAKLHAEEAAACSVTAVDISHKMWSQLVRQKDSGVSPDIEAKIVSAALTIAAALAVAKAAAAAAKVASDAAVQAKLMAEESMNSSRAPLVDLSTGISHNSSVSSLANYMPPSILKGENEVNSGISLTDGFTNLEKTESASAAVKRAENLNAILKAAELAAEAVTQAGKVAVMGNPLPLSELVNAGPEGSWKLTFGREVHSNNVIGFHGIDVNNGVNTSRIISDTVDVPKKIPDDYNLDISLENRRNLASIDISCNIAKPQGDEENPIKEGSSVEIYKEGDGVKAAWFSAKVLELKNGEAYVCYTEKPPTESFGALKEWIRLDVQGNDAPKIRAPHPMTAMPSEGTRKRRREAMGKCFWSVGDRVDAWRQNCWWEGVITEKSSKDDTAFTVHFSEQGETLIIKACHLRPTLIWQDGKWVEWSSSMPNDGNTRQEKRVKLCDPELKAEGYEKASENIDPIESKIQEDSRLLGLSDNEKTFNVGKNNKDVNKPATHRMASGVSKTGKKRKLMDVCQHYVSQDGKTNENDDSTRPVKMPIPKGSRLAGWKNSTRVDLQDKKVPAILPKAPNSRIAPAVSDKTLEKKSASGTVSRNDNAFRSQGMTGFSSFSSIGKARKAPFEFSSTCSEKSIKKMPASTRSKSVVSSKTKFEPPSQKLRKIEENKVCNSTADTSNSEGLEARRSNRRIQPTSRLLEGLQTSLSIPKLQSSSHDKGLKSHNRNASSRGNV